MPLPPSIQLSATELGISERMAYSLQGSHRPIIVVKTLTPKGVTYNIPVSSGTVTVDNTSVDFRRTFSFVTNAETVYATDGTPGTVAPTDDYGPINIYGHHCFIYRGIVWDADRIPPQLWQAEAQIPDYLLRFDNLASNPPDGTPPWAIALAQNPPYELVPLGVFRINEVEVDEQTDGQLTVTVSGADLSVNIARNAWTSPVTVWNKQYTVPLAKSDTTPEQTYIASTYEEAIKDLINNRWPIGHSVFGGPVFNFNEGLKDAKITAPIILGATNVTSSQSSSPWTQISALAAAINCMLYIDQRGRFTLRTIPDPNSMNPVWQFRDGEGGLLTDINRTLSDSKSANYVIATGENAGTKQAIKAVAADDDPNSPTYYLGSYGRMVGYEPGRKKLTTLAMVQKAADTYLNWFVGGDDSTTFSGITNPALDADMVVLIRRQRIGIYDNQAVIGSLSANTGAETISSLTVAPLSASVIGQTVVADVGDSIIIFSDAGKDQVIVTSQAKVGDTVIHVKEFKPKLNYRKGTALLDPTVPTDGSVPFYIDKVVTPLDITSTQQFTARSRRTGTKADSIRTAAYSGTD